MIDVKARIAKATRTAGKMRNIWASKHVPLRLKIRLYKAVVCSQLTYGSEAWALSSSVIKAINGANSKMMSRITNKTIHEETSADTRTFDLVRWIRGCRVQWLGHILRMDKRRMVYKAVHHLYLHQRREGDILMDAPTGYTWDELCMIAADRSRWRKIVAAVKTPARRSVTLQARATTNQYHHPDRCTSMVTRSCTTKPAIGPNLTAPMATGTNTTRSNATKTVTSTSKYRERDAHEILFRPALTRRKRTRKTKQDRKKPKPWSDKQRAASARAHWILHHTNPFEDRT